MARSQMAESAIEVGIPARVFNVVQGVGETAVVTRN